MTTGTSNPVGSSDPRDLLANAENLDRLVNGSSDEYPDRFSVLRKSWAYIESLIDPITSIFVPYAGATGDVNLGAHKLIADEVQADIAASYVVQDDYHLMHTENQSDYWNGKLGNDDLAPTIHAATSKATPVDADEIPLVDSAASNALKKLTWANLKAALKTYFDTLYKPYVTPSGTYATMVALSSPSVGQQYICTDCNNSTWTYNGTAWKPVGGRFMLWASTVASGVAPSGTINTGSSGNITLGTALDKTYAYGVFLELPAIATTPAIAAGKYYCVMSSTTVGTIYSTSWSGNVPTIGAAINFSAGTTYTGITTRIECYTATSLPGNVMGLGGSVVLEYSASIKNNANNKVYSVAWGSLSGLGGNGNTNIAGYAGAVMMITNMGDTSHQTFTPNPMSPPASMGVPGGSAQDTTTSKTVSIGVTMAVATDYYIFQQFNMWVVVP